MIGDISEAAEIIKNDEMFYGYDIIKAYECDFADEYFYAFRVCKKGAKDHPGLTSFLALVFESGEIVSGDRIIEPPGGKEVPIP